MPQRQSHPPALANGCSPTDSLFGEAFSLLFPSPSASVRSKPLKMFAICGERRTFRNFPCSEGNFPCSRLVTGRCPTSLPWARRRAPSTARSARFPSPASRVRILNERLGPSSPAFSGGGRPRGTRGGGGSELGGIVSIWLKREKLL